MRYLLSSALVIILFSCNNAKSNKSQNLSDSNETGNHVPLTVKDSLKMANKARRNLGGQQEDLIKYLNAYKTAEFEESQKIIADYSFGQKPEYTISEYSKFEGVSFPTDLPEINGYKAIGTCKIMNRAGGLIEKKMMAVMYYDKAVNHWAVFCLREAIETKQEYLISKSEVEKGKFYTSKEFVYRNLSYWSLMSGHLQDAKNYIELATSCAKQSKSKIPFTDEGYPAILKSITQDEISGHFSNS